MSIPSRTPGFAQDVLDGISSPAQSGSKRSSGWVDIEDPKRAQLYSKGNQFIDKFNRTLHLRGVNLCGNSKNPIRKRKEGFVFLIQSIFNYLGPLTKEEFFDHRSMSFIGLPFPINKADEHFGRLRTWGLTFVRLLVPWESLEYKGPGIYDEDFIDYLIKILKIANKYGIQAFIDPHQDTWSRFSGGSGAPGWAFEVSGMDLTKIKVTGAAHLHQLSSENDSNEPNIALWATSYFKLASATMFTLFFAGETFAPNTYYKGVQIQEFLQSSFINCYQHLAERLKGLESVVGFEVMNEPHYGYIGLESVKNHFDPYKSITLGKSPTPLQSFAIGNGIPQAVEFWVKSWPVPTRRTTTKVIINSEGESVWLDGKECIWKQHGVWGLDESNTPVALIDDYFKYHPITKKPVDFLDDFYVPFVKRYNFSIRSTNPELFIFFEPIPNEYPPVMGSEVTPDKNYVYAPHWYDLNTMFTKTFYGFITHDVQGLSKGTKNIVQATYYGLSGANDNYKFQVSNLVSSGLKNVGVTPILIGECGIPMDINGKKAFENGDYRHHNNFLDAVINAMESNFVNFTLWNYNPDNDNTFGDHWNGEDFSIYSPKPKPKLAAVSTSATPKKILFSSGNADSTTPEPQPLKPKNPTPENIITKSDTSLAPSSPSLKSGSIPQSLFDLTSIYFDMVDMEGDRDHHHHQGGRGLDAIIRAYAAKTAGEPTLMKFDLKYLHFKLEFKTKVIYSPNAPAKSFITEIFIPNYHYGTTTDLQIRVSDGEYLYDREKQSLFWKYDPTYMGMVKNNMVVHRIEVFDPELERLRESDVWRWNLLVGGGVVVGVLAIFFYFFL